MSQANVIDLPDAVLDRMMRRASAVAEAHGLPARVSADVVRLLVDAWAEGRIASEPRRGKKGGR